MKFRFNIFETNSSSTHEIVLTKEKNLDKKLAEILEDYDFYEDKNIDFYKISDLEEGYGWETFVLTSELNKLDYVIAQILNTNWFKISKWYSENEKQFNKARKFIWNLFRDRLFEKIGYNIMLPIDFKNDKRDLHYVDHQSTILEDTWINNTNDIIIILNNLWDMVFNPKIIIVGGNDNDGRDKQIDIIISHNGEIIKNPFTRTKDIEDVFGKYKHSITNFGKSLNKGTIE